MKISHVYSLFLLFFSLSTQLFSSQWMETGDLPNNGINFTPCLEQVVIDTKGNATAVWLDVTGSEAQSQGRLSAATLKIHSETWIPTNHFTDYPNEVVKGDKNFDSISESQLVISNEGIVAIIWAASPVDNKNITLIKSSFLKPGSQIWDKPKLIAKIINPKGLTSGQPSLAFDLNSRLYATWTDSSEGKQKIKSSFLDINSKKWSTPLIISDSNATKKLNNNASKLAVNHFQDRVVSIWQVQKGPDFFLYGSYMLIGTNKWSPPLLISSADNSLANRQYVVNQVNTKTNRNYAIVSWIERENQTSHLNYAILDELNTWTTQLKLADAPHIEKISMAIDKEKNATIVYGYISKNYETFKILAIDIPFAHQPTLPVQLSGPNLSEIPVVVVDPSGKTIVIWRGLIRKLKFSIFSVDRVKNGKWTSPIQISNESESESADFFLNLAVNAVGTTLAIWNEQGPSNTVQAARRKGNLPPPTLVLPPACINKGQKTNSFLLQHQDYPVIKWCKSPSKDVVKYLIYRDDLLIATVKATRPLYFIDEDRKKDTISVYTIKAVSKNGEQSQAVTTTLP